MTTQTAPADENLPPFELVPPGRLRDALVDAVLRGVKTATSRLPVLDELSGTPAEPAGTRLRLIDSAGGTAAIVEIDEVREIALAEVGDDVAHAEGDWFDDAAAWRVAHERYWSQLVDEIRAHTGDGEWALHDGTIVVVRFFHVVDPRA